MSKEYAQRSDIKILIIEDEALIAMSLKVKLIQEGYSLCETAENVKAAMEILQAEKPDLILADIILGDNENGIELVKKMRKTNPDLPVIFLTGYEIDEIRDKAMAVNPLEFFIKPVEMDLLMRIIDNHFGLKNGA